MQHSSIDHLDHENAFLLGEWQVLPDTGHLIKDGARVHVEPKVMAVLECLLRADGRLVSREELINKVWTHVVINDEVLTRAISELRTLLGDVNRDRRYIATIPKRGYKLLMPAPPMTVSLAVARTVPVDSSPAQAAHSRTEEGLFDTPAVGLVRRTARALWSQPLALTACLTLSLMFAFPLWMTTSDPNRQANTQAQSAASDEPRLSGSLTSLETELQHLQISQALTGFDEGTEPAVQLVLINPLTAITDDEATRMFAAGLSEDLQHAIFRETDLQVVQQLPEHHQESAFILSGSVRVYDQSTRINFQLVEALTSRLLWSSSFECPLDAVLSIQSQIARHTGKNLQRSLSGKV